MDLEGGAFVFSALYFVTYVGGCGVGGGVGVVLVLMVLLISLLLLLLLLAVRFWTTTAPTFPGSTRFTCSAQKTPCALLWVAVLTAYF